MTQKLMGRALTCDSCGAKHPLPEPMKPSEAAGKLCDKCGDILLTDREAMASDEMETLSEGLARIIDTTLRGFHDRHPGVTAQIKFNVSVVDDRRKKKS